MKPYGCAVLVFYNCFYVADAFQNQLSVTTWTHARTPQLLSTTATTSNDHNTDTQLLKGKLAILQDVVKQMQEKVERTKEDYEKSLQSLQHDFDGSKKVVTDQEERIQDFELQILKMKEDHGNIIERLQTARDQEYESHQQKMSALSEDSLDRLKNDYESRMVHLERQVSEKQDEINELTSALAIESKHRKNRIESLQEQIRNQNEERQIEQDKLLRCQEETKNEELLRANQTMETLKQEHTKLVDKYEMEMQEIKTEKDALLSECVANSKNSDEQVEIATAAVEAAEKREERIKKESDQLTNTLQRSRLVAKIMRLSSDEIVDENRELLSTNKKLKQKLDDCHEQIAEIDEKRSNKKWKWNKLVRLLRKESKSTNDRLNN